MGVAIGSSIQIALLVTPFLVMFGWAIGQPMTLHFETCKFLRMGRLDPPCWVEFSSRTGRCARETTCTHDLCLVSVVAFAFSVMVVTYTVQDGRSNYLEGAMVRPFSLSLLSVPTCFFPSWRENSAHSRLVYSFSASTALLRSPSTSAPRSMRARSSRLSLN